jgi:hypothetical protein
MLLVNAQMDKPIPDADAAVRPLTLFGVAVTGVLATACLGAVTNAFNGWVSPLYFVTIMRWDGVEDVWQASIAQGIFEGLLFGVLFSLVFAAGVGMITRVSCSFGFAVRHLLGIVAGALVGWVIGGVAAMGLASLSPDFYRRAFMGVPDEFGSMMAYAWVGGSIWGVQLGGLVSLILGLIVLAGQLAVVWQAERCGKGRAREVVSSLSNSLGRSRCRGLSCSLPSSPSLLATRLDRTRSQLDCVRIAYRS